MIKNFDSAEKSVYFAGEMCRRLATTVRRRFCRAMRATVHLNKQKFKS